MHYRKLMLHLPWSEIDTVFTLCDILSAPNNNYFFSFYSNPVDAGRKLNANKTFRRRPGRLLNVLCTFNLRPVSTGKAVEDEDAGFKNFWLTLEEAVRYFFLKKKSNRWIYDIALKYLSRGFTGNVLPCNPLLIIN